MAEPIRILHVLGILNRGGAETMIMNLYRNIDRSKIQFDFILHSQEKGYYDEEIINLGGRIFYVPRYSTKTVFNYIKVWNDFFHKHKEYRVIHGHVRSTASIYLNIAKKYKLTTIAHSHSTSSGFGLDAFVKDILQKPLKGNLADHLFSCSESAGKWLFGSKNMNRVSVLKNSIEVNKFTYNELVRTRMRSELGIDQRFAIGHVGRFQTEKNHEFLINIFEEVHDKNDKTVLILIGDGELRQSIERKVVDLGLSDSVIFTGIRSDIPALLQAIDVFLFPSLYEGLPVTLIEAQTAGLRIISSDTITEEVILTDLVEMVSLQQPDSYWADRVLQYSEGYERRNTNSEILNAGYDVKENAKGLEEFYLNVY